MEKVVAVRNNYYCPVCGNEISNRVRHLAHRDKAYEIKCQYCGTKMEYNKESRKKGA